MYGLAPLHPFLIQIIDIYCIYILIKLFWSNYTSGSPAKLRVYSSDFLRISNLLYDLYIYSWSFTKWDHNRIFMCSYQTIIIRIKISLRYSYIMIIKEMSFLNMFRYMICNRHRCLYLALLVERLVKFCNDSPRLKTTSIPLPTASKSGNDIHSLVSIWRVGT